MSAERKRILIVAHDRSTLHVARYHLTRAGFEVADTDNLEEARALVKATAPEIVVCELYEATDAKYNGHELRRRFFKNPGLRATPFLFLTDTPHPEQNGNVLGNAIDEYLKKPLDPLALIAQVQAMVTRRRTHEEMMRTDPLTHLLNRTTLENAVQTDLARLDRYARFAGILLLDIDELGAVNETQGDSAGDLVLTTLGSLISRTVRSTDIAGRYQSQQFVLYLPETREPGASQLAHRLQEQFQGLTQTALDAAMTFSAGVAEAPRDGDNWEQLLTRLNQAVHMAKANGKGEIVCWSEELSPLETET